MLGRPLLQSAHLFNRMTAVPVRGMKINKRIKNKRVTNIILIQDHPKLGAKGDIKTVRPGYHRNLLHPTGVSVYATRDNIKKYCPEQLSSDDNIDQSVLQERALKLAEKEEQSFAQFYVEQIKRVYIRTYRGQSSGDDDFNPMTLEHIQRKLYFKLGIMGVTTDMLSLPVDTEGCTDKAITAHGVYRIKVDLRKSAVREGLPINGFSQLISSYISEEELPHITVALQPRDASKLSDTVVLARKQWKERRKRMKAMSSSKDKGKKKK